MRENCDFYLVTEALYKYAESTYGLRGRPAIRYAIEQADGETCVELYLKPVNVLPVPSSTFKITEPKQLLISRTATLKDLKQKLLRSLNTILYEQGNKSTTVSKVRLWKIATPADDLENRQKNYSRIEVDGELLDDDSMVVDDLPIAVGEVLIAELPHKGEWVFNKKKVTAI